MENSTMITLVVIALIIVLGVGIFSFANLGNGNDNNSSDGEVGGERIFVLSAENFDYDYGEEENPTLRVREGDKVRIELNVFMTW